MPYIETGTVRIEYEALGDPLNSPLLLVMGLGMQMIAWPQSFCEALVAKGFYVIRFDNRDVGLSTHFHDASTPNLLWGAAKFIMGIPLQSAYSLNDMADDTQQLLKALNIPRAHIVGASMGGMIAQQLAARAPEMVLSLVSIMSTTGRRSLPGPTAAARRALMIKPAKRGDVEGAVTRMLSVLAAIGSPTRDAAGLPLYGATEADLQVEATVRRQFALAHTQRDYYPPGSARQIFAIAAAGDRRADIARIVAPTLVIHGALDPLVPVAAGRDTANTIPGAKLQVVESMGHDLPSRLYPLLVDAIAGHCSGIADRLKTA